MAGARQEWVEHTDLRDADGNPVHEIVVDGQSGIEKLSDSQRRTAEILLQNPEQHFTRKAIHTKRQKDFHKGTDHFLPLSSAFRHVCSHLYTEGRIEGQGSALHYNVAPITVEFPLPSPRHEALYKDVVATLPSEMLTKRMFTATRHLLALPEGVSIDVQDLFQKDRISTAVSQRFLDHINAAAGLDLELREYPRTVRHKTHTTLVPS